MPSPQVGALRRRRRSALAGAVLLLAAFPASAQAHTTIKGLGEFVGGLAHPVTTPTHLLLVLGLGLLLGQQVPMKLRRPMAVFAVLSAGALLWTMTGAVTACAPPVLIGMALGVGILVALEKRLPAPVSLVLIGVSAIAIGVDSSVETETRGAVLKTLLGTWVALLMVLVDVAWYASVCMKREWTRIGVRVLGAWIVAISLLVLAFSLRKP